MTSEPSSGAAPPAFGTAPWGYRRAEVDSWASWVAALIAHGRKETVRADSAEATLKATLERMEQLQRRPSDGEGPNEDRAAGDRAAGDRAAGDRAAGDRAAGAGSPPVGALPRRGAPASAADNGGGDRDRPELARLQVVERTLHEVMTLLHRLVGPGDRGGRPSAGSPPGSR